MDTVTSWMVPGYHLPLLVWGLHLVLLTTVVITDLTRRKVYRPWSAVALGAGVLTALRMPLPWLWLGSGALLFGLGFVGLAKGQLAGGDVWFLAYLGLLFGPLTGLPLLLGSSGVGLALLSRRLRWGDPLPLAAVWGGAALGIWCLLAPWPPVVTGELAAPVVDAPVPVTALSPLPTPTPDVVVVQIAEEAAATVARVGLVDAPQRPPHARRAAQTLRTLAGQAPRSDQRVLLRHWARALDRYSAGEPGALPLVRHWSEVNRSYFTGGPTWQAHQR